MAEELQPQTIPMVYTLIKKNPLQTVGDDVFRYLSDTGNESDIF